MPDSRWKLAEKCLAPAPSAPFRLLATLPALLTPPSTMEALQLFVRLPGGRLRACQAQPDASLTSLTGLEAAAGPGSAGLVRLGLGRHRRRLPPPPPAAALLAPSLLTLPAPTPRAACGVQWAHAGARYGPGPPGPVCRRDTRAVAAPMWRRRRRRLDGRRVSVQLPRDVCRQEARQGKRWVAGRASEGPAGGWAAVAGSKQGRRAGAHPAGVRPGRLPAAAPTNSGCDTPYLLLPYRSTLRRSGWHGGTAASSAACRCSRPAWPTSWAFCSTRMQSFRWVSH